ncbi:MAG: porin family protein [Candidatus Protochlamydia sp.]|nr:porin family protein [Candidatus Protochlamydia sp.]
MKKHLLIFLLLSVAGMQGLFANEYCYNSCQNEGWYVGGYGGTNWLHQNKHHEIKTRTGYTGAGSLGYKFDNGIRVEGEVAYRHNDIKSREHFNAYQGKGHTSVTSGMANVLYDFDTGTCITPYIGGGVGYSHLKVNAKCKNLVGSERFTGSDSGLAYQGIVGASVPVCHKTDLGVEYRYFGARKHAEDHSVGLALRHYF